MGIKEVITRDETTGQLNEVGLNHARFGDLVDVGEETIPRLAINNTGVGTTSGRLQLTYWTARKTETITALVLLSGNTAAAGVTLARAGIYEVAGNGDLTLVASIPSDTALFGATFSSYQRPLSASWSKVRGQRYALGKLVVATTVPSYVGQAGQIHIPAGSQRAPRMSGSVSGLTDLPASIAAGSITATTANPLYDLVVP